MMEEWNKNRSLRPDRTELAPHTEDESAEAPGAGGQTQAGAR